jgi:transcriptional regulator with XRE-family HTH domain
MITLKQIKAARGHLDWTQTDLAEESGVSLDMIKKIERGTSRGSVESLELIQAALDRAGIQFLPNEGIAQKVGAVQSYRGRIGFIEFLLDVYETVRGGGDIYVSNVDETLFLKWEGDEAEAHMARMNSIKNLRFKILTPEGDTNFVASEYSEYKWIPKERNKSTNISFYIYGRKTAIINFEEDDVEVFVIHEENITQYFKHVFFEEWKEAIKPR